MLTTDTSHALGYILLDWDLSHDFMAIVGGPCSQRTLHFRYPLSSDCLSSSLGSIPEYELLLQVHYRNSKEKRELMKFLKFWVPYSFFLPEPVKIIRAKATTCESVS